MKIKNFFIKLKKKHSNNKKKYTNPYFKKRKKISIKIPACSWRVKMIILSTLIIVIGLAWLIFFAPIFNIKKVVVKGAIKISTKEIEDFAWEQAYSSWGYKKNIFLFCKSDLIKKINEKYSLNSLIIEKKLPNKLIINFNEKQQSIVWFEADKYYYADIIGSVISEADPLNISQKDIPLIYNSGDNKIIDKKIEINSDKIKFILDLFFEFKDKKHNFEIERFNIDNEEGTIELKVVSGPIIYFNIKDDLLKQVSKLDVTISQKLKEEF
ncbi:hypothetical protein KKA77_00065, partial [Patescibacteria group bacterium]|nr:hypothetical protein [Patescibacteria group bacterium]